MSDADPATQGFRLCLLGDSHLAAPKEFWSDEEHDGYGVSPTFIPGVRDTLTRLEAKDGLLHPTDEETREIFAFWGGAETLDPARFDGFALIGLGLRFQVALRAILARRLHVGGGGDRLISKPAFVAALMDRLADVPAPVIVRYLRAVTDKPILVLPQPRPVEMYLEQEQRSGLDRPTIELAYELFRSTLDAIFEGLDVEILDQDPASFAPSGLTDDRYSTGKYVVDGKKRNRRDTSHMNAAYGGIQLEQIAHHVATRTALG